MAKKRKNPFEGVGGMFPGMDDDLFMGLPSEIKPETLMSLAPILKGMSDEDAAYLFSILGYIVEMGVTPEEYATFSFIYREMRKALEPDAKSGKKKVKKSSGKTLKKSGETGKTLLLKIQMKGVTKPPMWREIEVSADMTFRDLHRTIQCVMGLENCHLWRFGDRAFGGGLCIAHKSRNDYDMGLDYVDEEADETSLYYYLAREGASLEYVYDFGDDWVFTVTVKKILEQNCDHPVCKAFKGELNPIEDSGGIWSYMGMRDCLAEWDKMTKKEREEAAEDSWFDDPEEYHQMLLGAVFNLEEVNSRLKNI